MSLHTVSLLRPIRHLGDRLSQGWQAQSPINGVRSLGVAYKPWLRDGLAEVLAKVGATVPSRFARRALTIVSFHHVLPEEKLQRYPIGRLAMSPEQLELILSELRQSFEVGSVIDSFRAWASGATSERPRLGLSFDGGALGHFEHARPVLEKLGLRATFYVPVKDLEEGRPPWHDRVGFALLRAVAAVRQANGVDFDALLAPFGTSVESFAAVLPDDAVRLAAGGVERARGLPFDACERAIAALEAALGGSAVPDYLALMSRDQLRELHRAGHEIGSQSLPHPRSSELPLARVREQVELSRRELGRIIGADVHSCSYPNADHDARLVGVVEAAGYACAVTARAGVNRKAAAFELARCDMDFEQLRSRHGEFSRDRLLLRLSGLEPNLPAMTHVS